MATPEQIYAGDFTKLATYYSKYRPGYSETVVDGILEIMNQPITNVEFVDVGAGTGIWTRQFAKRACKVVIAIEPNDRMRQEGMQTGKELGITWLVGSAEKTLLESNSADLVTMASSFHWADFDLATREFYRILKPNGYFVILWNPRYLENNVLLQEIEDHIYQLKPDIRRISSGKSKHVDQLANQLLQCSLFENGTYLEGFHTISLSSEEYLGAWKSVNDIRVQLGEIKFCEFIKFVEDKIKLHQTISCTYQTRAWIVKRK